MKTPAGNDLPTLWSVLLAGRSVIAPIQRFDASDLPVRFAGEVTGFDPAAYLGAKEARQLDRATQLGFGAAADALEDSALDPPDLDRCGVVAGTGMGGLVSYHELNRIYLQSGAARVSPRAIPMIMPNALAALIAIQFGWRGPNMCIATACAAGAHAIGEGARLVREGAADVLLAGGAEAAVTQVAIAGFARMGALSTRNDEPERASRPFDAMRDGFVIGEGAAFVVMESYERAFARSARVYGEIVGYGRNCDAFHVTVPSTGGAGAVACMRLALDDAGLDTSAIGHINAHGTSTQFNDAAEAVAIQKVFNSTAPPVTSTKGAIGHLIGAAGAIEVVSSFLAMGHGLVPPTANFERAGDDINLDVVARVPRPVVGAPVLSNSFAFGGHNVSLVLAP